MFCYLCLATFFLCFAVFEGGYRLGGLLGPKKTIIEVGGKVRWVQQNITKNNKEYESTVKKK